MISLWLITLRRSDGVDVAFDLMFVELLGLCPAEQGFHGV
jgi:hypothetical protein